MSRSTLVLVSLLGGIAVLVAIVLVAIPRQGGKDAAPGRWTESERTSFIESCVKSCRNSPGVTPDRYPLCDKACTCTADEGEKIIGSAELVAIYLGDKTGLASDDQKAKLQKLKDIGLACAKKSAQ
jgi:hypothetical protein